MSNHTSNHISLKTQLNRLASGVATYAAVKAMFFTSFPFPFPEKAITYDWDNIGTDINIAITQLEKENER
jgi:hypothetical protein